MEAVGVVKEAGAVGVARVVGVSILQPLWLIYTILYLATL